MLEIHYKSCLWYLVFFMLFVFYFPECSGHGRLIEPPSRASAWRYGFQTPPDYNDHELYCGGYTRQWKRNEGKCGVCGDAWDLPEPRPHENGGQWGQAVVVRKYLPGSEIVIRVELTASHMGYFEFRICPDPNASQDCLDKHLLRILGGSPSQPMPSDIDTRFYPRNGSRIYEMKAQLPNIDCNQCVIQWRYIAGNNWGMCPDGNGAVGCGPQEEFRSCADIALGEGAHLPIRPMPPFPRTTVQPPTTISGKTQHEPSEDSNYFWIVLLILALFIVMCALCAWYMLKYHNQKVTEWLHIACNGICWNRNKQISQRNIASKSPIAALENPFVVKNTENTDAYNLNESSQNPPIPPPRVKRNSKVKEISPEESSVY